MSDSPFDLSTISASGRIASLEYQPAVESTNTWALQLAADAQRPLPLLVLTAQQTAGRGRGANAWWASEGALTFSLILDAKVSQLSMERWPQVAILAGLAVCEALRELYPPGVFALKWPNDVYLQGRKICGILVETPSQSHGRIVVGAGINVNNAFTSAPPELRAKATSLAEVAGGTFDLTETLLSVLRRFEVRWREFVTNAIPLATEFRRYCLLTGRVVTIARGDHEITGVCQGIDDEGRLLVRTVSGLHCVTSGSVEFE